MKVKVILASALVLAVVYVASSSASSGDWTVERYYADETWHAFADNSKKDNGGPGDIYAAQQTLKRTNGESVGVVNGYGVNLHPPYVFFHWTGTLGGGTLTMESAVNLRNKTIAYPIEGGTGRYAGVRGTVTLTDAGKKGALVTVRYQR